MTSGAGMGGSMVMVACGCRCKCGLWGGAPVIMPRGCRHVAEPRSKICCLHINLACVILQFGFVSKGYHFLTLCTVCAFWGYGFLTFDFHIGNLHRPLPLFTLITFFHATHRSFGTMASVLATRCLLASDPSNTFPWHWTASCAAPTVPCGTQNQSLGITGVFVSSWRRNNEFSVMHDEYILGAQRERTVAGPTTNLIPPALPLMLLRHKQHVPNRSIWNKPRNTERQGRTKESVMVDHIAMVDHLHDSHRSGWGWRIGFIEGRHAAGRFTPTPSDFCHAVPWITWRAGFAQHKWDWEEGC
jgi:hypothetical protein